MNQTTNTNAATILRDALRDIINPIAAMQRDLPEGYSLNGHAALAALGNHETYKRIAEKALAAAECAAIQPAGEAVGYVEVIDLRHLIQCMAEGTKTAIKMYSYSSEERGFETPVFAIPQQAKAEQVETPLEIPEHWLDRAKWITCGDLVEAERGRLAVMLLTIMLKSRRDNPAAPAAHSEAGELPPLPESDWVLQGSANNRDAYTADQMREYGQLCRDTAPSSVTGASGSVGDDAEFMRLLAIHADDEQGRMRTVRQIIEHIDARSPVAAAPESCAKCAGTGRVIDDAKCSACNATGTAPTASTPPAPAQAEETLNIAANRAAAMAVYHGVGAEICREIAEAVRMAPAQAAQVGAVTDKIATAYGIMWHVNAGMDAPAEVSPLTVTPERGAYEARKVLRDLLTNEQRGAGINAAREILAKRAEKGSK